MGYGQDTAKIRTLRNKVRYLSLSILQAERTRIPRTTDSRPCSSTLLIHQDFVRACRASRCSMYQFCPYPVRTRPSTGGFTPTPAMPTCFRREFWKPMLPIRTLREAAGWFGEARGMVWRRRFRSVWRLGHGCMEPILRITCARHSKTIEHRSITCARPALLRSGMMMGCGLVTRKQKKA